MLSFEIEWLDNKYKKLSNLAKEDKKRLSNLRLRNK